MCPFFAPKTLTLIHRNYKCKKFNVEILYFSWGIDIITSLDLRCVYKRLNIIEIFVKFHHHNFFEQVVQVMMMMEVFRAMHWCSGRDGGQQMIDFSWIFCAAFTIQQENNDLDLGLQLFSINRPKLACWPGLLVRQFHNPDRPRDRFSWVNPESIFASSICRVTKS